MYNCYDLCISLMNETLNAFAEGNEKSQHDADQYIRELVSAPITNDTEIALVYKRTVISESHCVIRFDGQRWTITPDDSVPNRCVRIIVHNSAMVEESTATIAYDDIDNIACVNYSGFWPDTNVGLI